MRKVAFYLGLLIAGALAADVSVGIGIGGGSPDNYYCDAYGNCYYTDDYGWYGPGFYWGAWYGDWDSWNGGHWRGHNHHHWNDHGHGGHHGGGHHGGGHHH